MAVAVRLLRPLILFLYIFLVILFPMSVSIPDSEALLKLKKSFTNTKSLDSWDPSSQPCTGKTRWNGLICYDGIVNGLHLQGMGLSGSIDVDALLEIPGLRTFSLVNNSFSGSIPELYRLGALKAVYLSKNQFSGHIPSDFFATMTSLKKVWLSNNKFSGVIPSSLSQLPNLIELHIENNHFTGPIPAIDQPNLKSLNVSNNKLEGEIPMGLSKFNASSFTGNVGLCGDAVGKMCDEASNENRASADSHNQRLKENDRVAAAIMAMAVVLLSLTVVAIVVMKRREEEKFDVFGMDKQDDAPVEVHVSGPKTKEMGSGRMSMGGSSIRKGSPHGSHKGIGGGGGTGAMGDLVLVNDEKGAFGLTDLMKAAAEVLGNGALGSSYKALMSNGVAVVVKRMREMNRIAREGFEAEFRRLGKLRHCNILTPLAYHYRKDEKLLIYEFIPKGSLLFVLHGDRGATHADLDWPARLKIIQGIARGLGYLHTELAPSDLPHGNLKSSNVLLSSNNEPLLSDYGFSPLINAAQLSHALFAYKAPEAAQYHKISPKCDVYCLGIIILETLTGKFPSQYLNNGKGGTDVVHWVLSAIREGREFELFDPEIAATSANSLGEMGRLLYIGAACTEKNPEQRLDMREAIKRIEGIKVGGGSGCSQENRTIQLLPSLRDGYAESATVASNGTSSRQGHAANSGRSDGIEDQSSRLNSNSFAFPIS